MLILNLRFSRLRTLQQISEGSRQTKSACEHRNHRTSSEFVLLQIPSQGRNTILRQYKHCEGVPLFRSHIGGDNSFCSRRQRTSRTACTNLRSTNQISPRKNIAYSSKQYSEQILTPEINVSNKSSVIGGRGKPLSSVTPYSTDGAEKLIISKSLVLC